MARPRPGRVDGQDASAAKAEQDLATAAHRTQSPPEPVSFTNSRQEELLAVGAAIDNPGWTVIVEQPTFDAFSLSRSLQRQLFGAIGLALLGTVILGWVWGRSFIQRIFALTRVTRAIADGRMDERVVLTGQDEIRQLGDAFNSMADRLVELQEEIRKQERQAMFGRIAAGLVHDLSHPIQNIGNSCKLIQKMFEDAEYRETFKRTVERELVIIKRVLDDLRNIARPIPLERFPVDLNRTVGDAAEAMEPHAETAGLTLRTELSPETVYIEGDVFALGRVYRNLILNAIQATAPGGLIVVSERGTRGSRPGADLRHRLRNPAGTPGPDLRGLRDDQAPRPRAGAGDLQEDRRAARRHDLGGERGRQGHDIRARFSAHSSAAHARRWLILGFYRVLGFCEVLPGSTGSRVLRGSWEVCQK